MTRRSFFVKSPTVSKSNIVTFCGLLNVNMPARSALRPSSELPMAAFRLIVRLR